MGQQNEVQLHHRESNDDCKNQKIIIVVDDETGQNPSNTEAAKLQSDVSLVNI